MRIVRLLLLVVASLSAFNAFSVDVNNYVPKNKESLKEIVMTNLPIKIIGWVDKQKQLADGSPIEIWHSQPWYSCGKIIDGIVSRTDSSTCIDGTFYQRYEPNKAGLYQFLRNSPSANDSIVGRFSIQNTKDGKFRADKKNDKIDGIIVPLSVNVININNIGKVPCDNSSVTLNVIRQDNGNFYATLNPNTKSSGWLSNAELIETTTTSIDLLFSSDLKLSSDIDWHIVLKNGDEWFGTIDKNNNNEYTGKYLLPNGDMLFGNFEEPVFKEGWKWPRWYSNHSKKKYKITFADGSTIEPDAWIDSLKVYDILGEFGEFNVHNVKDINGDTPTEQRNNILAAIERVKQEELKKERERKQEELKKKEEERREKDINYLIQNAKSLDFFLKLSNNEALISKYEGKTFYIEGEIQSISKRTYKDGYFIFFKSPDSNWEIRGMSEDEKFSELLLPAKVIVKVTFSSVGHEMFGFCKFLNFDDIKLLARAKHN